MTETMAPIVLASSSPRRRQLLEMLRIPHRVIAPDIDESRRDGETPERYVVRLARAKARAVGERVPGELVLGADTTVVLDGELFGKPTDPEDAVLMLGRLQGHTHQVLTAVALSRDERLEHALDVSRVTFRPADRRLLADYVATGEPLVVAGSFTVDGYKLPVSCLVEIDGARGVFTVNATGEIACEKQGTGVVCDKTSVP